MDENDWVIGVTIWERGFFLKRKISTRKNPYNDKIKVGNRE